MKLKICIGIAIVLATMFSGCKNDDGFEPWVEMRKDIPPAEFRNSWGVAGRRSDLNNRDAPPVRLFNITGGSSTSGDIIWYENHLGYVDEGIEEELDFTKPFEAYDSARGTWTEKARNVSKTDADGTIHNDWVEIEVQYTQYSGKALRRSYRQAIKFFNKFQRDEYAKNSTPWTDLSENDFFPDEGWGYGKDYRLPASAGGGILANIHPIQELLLWELQRMGYGNTFKEIKVDKDGKPILDENDDPIIISDDKVKDGHGNYFNLVTRDELVTKKFNALYEPKKAYYRIEGNNIFMRWRYTWELQARYDANGDIVADPDVTKNDYIVLGDAEWHAYMPEIWCVVTN